MFYVLLLCSNGNKELKYARVCGVPVWFSIPVTECHCRAVGLGGQEASVVLEGRELEAGVDGQLHVDGAGEGAGAIYSFF